MAETLVRSPLAHPTSRSSSRSIAMQRVVDGSWRTSPLPTFTSFQPSSLTSCSAWTPTRSSSVPVWRKLPQHGSLKIKGSVSSGPIESMRVEIRVTGHGPPELFPGHAEPGGSDIPRPDVCSVASVPMRFPMAMKWERHRKVAATSTPLLSSEPCPIEDFSHLVDWLSVI